MPALLVSLVLALGSFFGGFWFKTLELFSNEKVVHFLAEVLGQILSRVATIAISSALGI